MNGDADKLSAGAVYPSSSESSMTNVVIEQQQQQHHIQQTLQSANNIILGPPPGKFSGIRSAVTLAAGATLEIPVDAGDLTTTMNGGISGSSSDGGAIDAYAESNASGGDPNYPTVDGNTLPLDQLKQMLSTQLEYYFSR